MSDTDKPNGPEDQAEEPRDADPRDAQIAALEAKLAALTKGPDERDRRLAELRAQIDAHEKAAQSEVVLRPDGLVGPAHSPWDDIAKADDVPLSEVTDPVAREILRRLRASEKDNADLRRQLASKAAVSNDAAAPGRVILHLSNGKVVAHATSIPTHHYDDGVLHRVVAGYLEDDPDGPADN